MDDKSQASSMIIWKLKYNKASGWKMNNSPCMKWSSITQVRSSSPRSTRELAPHETNHHNKVFDKRRWNERKMKNDVANDEKEVKLVKNWCWVNVWACRVQRRRWIGLGAPKTLRRMPLNSWFSWPGPFLRVLDVLGPFCNFRKFSAFQNFGTLAVISSKSSKGEGAKMILNFTQKCVCNIKVPRGA